MINRKIGFIGCGNMGKAMISGLLSSKEVRSGDIIASVSSKASKERLENEFNILVTTDNIKVASESNILFLGVKPHLYKTVIDEVKSYLKDDVIIISIAAGLSLKDIESYLDKDYKIVKTMPNTPALVKEAMCAICPNKNITKEDLNLVLKLYESFGEVEVLEEKHFHAFTALCGSSPAYVFMFIEAMADAAVKLGLPREKSYKMASQAILGSAKVALDSKKHPGELKDMVCSPGGTTIEAVIELESLGFRNSVIKAIEKCEEKSRHMGKN